MPSRSPVAATTGDSPAVIGKSPISTLYSEAWRDVLHWPPSVHLVDDGGGTDRGGAVECGDGEFSELRLRTPRCLTTNGAQVSP